ncbi:major facilitator superfamily domain-containing protein 6-like [Dendronephthya gigantea]|uniref:major facilitator superfamily domain-containing protein 6-like n=1 Tax=Dendronephthya gigantea TaxID=151771 RepID=UPI00106BE332|nr:major facilitator superfamily domain-containing protein 6-like [Dendronephthya gigantea]
MANISIKSVALKWFYFTCLGGMVLYSEFCHLAFKRYGLTPEQIGFTTLMGVQHFLLPFILLVADKFRARKPAVLAGTIVLVLACLLAYSPMIISPTCFYSPKLSSNNSNDLMSIPQHGQLANGSVNISSSNDTYVSTSGLQFQESPPIQHVPWLSTLFIFMVASRLITIMLESLIICLANLAVVAYLKEKRSDYGEYFMWSHIGGGVAIFGVALLAWAVRIEFCGIKGYGYNLMFIAVGCMALLSMMSLPWLTFEYEETKTINWRELKSTLFNFHYVFMFFVLWYCGACISFQINWEFWYLDKLTASPLLMGGVALIRRPLLALSAYMSVHLLKYIGEMKTICVALLSYSMSFFALSFTRIPWFVLGIDIFQVLAYGLSYCAFTVHFSKAGSKQLSGVILGMVETSFSIGIDAGTTVIGVLFNALGTRITLMIFSLSSFLIFIALLLYIIFSKHVEDDYEELSQEDSANKYDDPEDNHE